MVTDMNINAEVVCRKESYGAVCRWKGPRRGVAKIYGDVITESLQTKHIKSGDAFTFGRLRFRVVQWPLYGSAGGAMDAAAVMLESPHAQLYQLYREKAESFVRFIARCEMAALAFNGKLREGQLLSFTARIADKLL